MELPGGGSTSAMASDAKPTEMVRVVSCRIAAEASRYPAASAGTHDAGATQHHTPKYAASITSPNAARAGESKRISGSAPKA